MQNYSLRDVKKVSYGDFDMLVGKLTIQVQTFLERNHMDIDMIVPLFRNGMLPAQRLASAFSVNTILPYESKYHVSPAGSLKHTLTHKETTLENEYCQTLISPKGILILDVHTISGSYPKVVVNELKRFYPGVPLLFLTLVFSDIACRDFPCPLIYCQKSRECLQEHGVLDKVFVFPWENENEVLQDLNLMLRDMG